MDDMKIMVVDDEDIILDSIRDYMDEYPIYTFQDSIEASKELENNFYDIIVSDYKMPGKNGLELFFEAKKNKSYYYGILLTAYADKEMLKEFINHDVIKGVIEKPLKLELLKGVIDKALIECQKWRDNTTKNIHMKLICKQTFKGLDFLNDFIIGFQ